jgi:hypothetical protein
MSGAEYIKKWLKRFVHPLLGLQKGRSRSILRGIIGGVIGLMLFGCVNRAQPVQLLELPDVPSNNEVRRLKGSVQEVAPPAVFLDLDDLLIGTAPQVAIASPKPDQIIDTTRLSVKIKLRGLSIYKDKNLELGPHLQVSLDNQPARSIYSLEEDLEFLDLAPGSHTLRVLAVKPWGESFKNEAAYAQTTFHVFAKTDENTPNPEQPQLIYSAPQGTYGAQPILLDFYLNNAPLHLIAQSDPSVTDWKIRCEVNGQSFVFDQWQPIYLKGLKPGENWVQLTLIDEQGTPIDNAFNSTVRIINYDLDQRDTLAKMTRGELQLKDVGQIVDANYEPPVEVLPEIAPPSKPEPSAEEKTEPEKTEPEIEEATPEQEAPVAPEPEAKPEALEPEPEAEVESRPESEQVPEAVEANEIEANEIETNEIDKTDDKAALEVEKRHDHEPETTFSKEPSVIPLTSPQTDVEAVNKPGVLNRIQTFWQRLQTSESEQPADTTAPALTEDLTLTEDELLEKSIFDDLGFEELDPEKSDLEKSDLEQLDGKAEQEPISEPKQLPQAVLESEPSVIPLAPPQARSEEINQPGIFDRIKNTWQQLQTAHSDQPSSIETTNLPTNDALIKDELLEKAVNDELIIEKPITNEPVTDETVIDETVTENLAADERKRLTIPPTLTSPNAPGEPLIIRPQE